MFKEFKDYLPSYLNKDPDSNVYKYNEVMKRQDKKIDDIINLTRLWANPVRPIMFQCEEIENTPTGIRSVTPIETEEELITTHIQTDEIIKHVKEEIKYNSEVTNLRETSFDEANVVTSLTTSFIVPVTHTYTVTVETYNNHTYKKAYPEDPSLGEYHTPDIFLDGLGALLKIPRRDGELDYDYSQRIDYFMEHYNEMDLYLLMLYLIYDIENPVFTDMSERLTSIPEYLIGCEGKSWVRVLEGYDNQIELEKFINQFLPITRPILVRRIIDYRLGFLEPADYMMDICVATGSQSPFYPNTTYLVPYFSPRLVNAPVNVYVDGTFVQTVNSNNNGQIPIHLYGLGGGTHTLTVEYEGEYEIEGVLNEVEITTFDEIARQEPCWKIGKYTDYTNTLIDPTFDEVEDMLIVGSGYLLYTPIINYNTLDEFSIYGTFFIGGDDKKLGIIKVQEDENGIKESGGLFVDLSKYISEGDYDNHDFCFDFVDDEIYFYIDDVAVGVRKNISRDGGLWYLGAYNADEYTGLGLGNMYTADEVMFGAYPIINHKYWKVIQGTGSIRAPSYDGTNNEYDIGRNYISVLSEYLINSNITSTTIEIDFNTQTRTQFRIGLLLDKNTTVGWYDSYFNATNNPVSIGDHTLKFVSNSNGVWKTYIDNNQTSNAEFTLNNDRNIGVINYNANAVKITAIKIYNNE